MKSSRAMIVGELLLMLTLIFVGQWVLPYWLGHPIFPFAYFGLLALGTWLLFYVGPFVHRVTWEQCGLGSNAKGLFLVNQHCLAAAVPIGKFTLLASFGCVTVAAIWPSRVPQLEVKALLLAFIVYLGYALVQELLFFAFFATRMRLLLSGVEDWSTRGVFAVLVGGATGLVHAPNWPVMAMVSLAGVVWGYSFARAPSLLPIVVSHAWLRLLVHDVLGVNLAVGARYFDPELSVFRAALRVLYRAVSA